MNTVNVELPPQTVLDVDVCEELGLIVSLYKAFCEWYCT